MAKRYMNSQKPAHTLQTTALIHEAYLRMVKQEDKHFENRAHFFGGAAQVMRRLPPSTEDATEIKFLLLSRGVQLAPESDDGALNLTPIAPQSTGTNRKSSLVGCERGRRVLPAASITKS